ncbi:transcriptional regulator [Streptomyces sp. HC44]|uniref:Transcriptional regulator n=1 Tax=Streptomyces scabichelini TaxID=2711217 RepID=A0A6G4VBV9_9ACTN|nr:zinc ribbon domain-containing protein [Streptomyces scabichelini]NGO11579.1 transcriptional regulator [Streptomyces scabichelini]
MWSPTEPVYRIATPTTAKAWRSRDGRYRLAGNRCAGCALTFFPKRRVCPTCHSRTLTETVMAPYGRVVGTAEDQTPLIGHTGRGSRPFAIVALEDGPHILTELVDTDAEGGPGAVTEGTEVELVVRKWRREAAGPYQYGYKFRPRRAR